MAEKIESTANLYIKELKKLQNKSHRYEKGLFMVEGINCVKELIDFRPETVECLLTTENNYKDSYKNFHCIEVSERVMEAICETKTPQGIAAVAKMIMKTDTNSEMAIYLDNVKDPGNLGTIIRTADAAGINTVILSRECADLYNSKTVRSTMGSMFHINVYYEEQYLEELKKLKSSGYEIIAGSLQADCSLYDVDFQKKSVICIGNEAHGISQELYNLGVKKIKIPINGKAESLNAAIAGAVIMYEAVRQRL